MPAHTRCRVCDTHLPEPFLDLGEMPLANAFLSSPEEFEKEWTYPLAVVLCPTCHFVQLNFVVGAEQLYRNYLYVSSTSEAVQRYATRFASQVIKHKSLTSTDLVVELGSNDGLVLKTFQQQGVRVLGIEPARNIAEVARANGIPTIEEFFSEATADRLRRDEGKAAVLMGRHVFAHIHDLHDFFNGVEKLLAPDGTLLIEVPYLGNLIRQLEFDTIYHEHLSYVSLEPLRKLCSFHGFVLTDVEPVPLHGGSILLSIRRKGKAIPTPQLDQMLQAEARMGLNEPAIYQKFSGRVAQWKDSFEALLDSLSKEGATCVGYGAAAKANTLLNFCPKAARQLSCILDKNPLKQGLYTPGTHLPVVSVQGWQPNGTSHMVILAWNFKEEIISQMSPFAKRGGRFVVPIPQPEVL